jgi:hypothetical protein
MNNIYTNFVFFIIQHKMKNAFSCKKHNYLKLKSIFGNSIQNFIQYCLITLQYII